MVLRGERLRDSGRPAAFKLGVDAPLATAWAVLVALLAGTVAWLIWRADDTALIHPINPTAIVLPVEPRSLPVAEAPVPVEAPPPQIAAAEPAPEPAAVAPTAAPATAEPASPAAPPAMPAEVAGSAPVAAEADPEALIPAPDPALTEQTPLGPLPRIGADGRRPWRVYARPYDGPEKGPKIALVVTGLGLSYASTRAAIEKLPASVTFSFDPYTDSLDQWIAAARGRGHEVLLDLPLEPINYPQSDPGPQTLLLGSSAAENLARLNWVLTRGTGYVGVASAYGASFAGAVNSMLPVLQTLHQRGLVYVDNRLGGHALPTRLARDIGVPLVANDRYVDAEGTRGALDVRLADLEKQARSSGRAVGFAAPHPMTIERLADWVAQLAKKKIAIAPVTAMVER
jgi:polysaccharide deacetylase 2 family uncharacterized protein YibQ